LPGAVDFIHLYLENLDEKFAKPAAS